MVAVRRLAALAALGLALLAAPAAAQEPPAPDPAVTTPAPAAPDTTVLPATTTIPAACSTPTEVAVEFVGKVTAGDTRVARFDVVEVRRGTPPGPTIDIDYGDTDDRRFVVDGKTYLVVAAVDPESTRLVSKVRRPRSEAAGCARFDPIYTNNADGSHIDSSVLGGIQGKSWDIAWAFLLPTLCIFAVLLGLVIVKHTFLLTGRGVRYARARHRSRPSPPAGRPPPAPGPRPARRTRTHTSTRSPG